MHGSSIVAIAGLALGFAGAAGAERIDAKVYERAAFHLPAHAAALVLNRSVAAHWRDGGARFTYRRALSDGRAEFVSVEAATGRRAPAFDAAVVAQGLSAALNRKIAADQPPFTDFETSGAHEIAVQVDGKALICGTRKPGCRPDDAPRAGPDEVASPDGHWFAYRKAYDVWIRSADGATRFALTTGGALNNAWGVTTQGNLSSNSAKGRDNTLRDADGRSIGFSSPLHVLWSPDSRRVFLQKLDERGVREVSLTQMTPPDGSLTPKVVSWRMAVPGDKVIPMLESWVFDVETRAGRKLAIDPMPSHYYVTVENHDAWWSPDSAKLYVLSRGRYWKSLTLFVADPATGETKALITETGKTFVEPSGLDTRPMTSTLANGDVVWFSERGGWGRLYLYDGQTGALKRPLTTGDWTVRNVLHVDEARGFIYVAGQERERGEDPYDRQVYRVRLRDGQTTRLTPETADHDVRGLQESIGARPDERDLQGFDPSGRYFLDAVSDIHTPARTVLRSAEGRQIAVVETADLSGLKALGFTPPERFTALAADGKTTLYGNILRPTDFDPRKRYPVVDAIYPGPQSHRATTRMVDALLDYAQGFAELGFVVVMVDGRGTEGRSKAFHDESYGHMLGGHLDDHVAVIKELGRRYAYLDLDRVGIVGGSAGGFASARALLDYPDFYKVGVSDAGAHDQRLVVGVWGETFMGPDTGKNYLESANAPYAANLKGKLLLMQGDMDTNAVPAQTYQFADALAKANKDFDLVVVSNTGHTTMLRNKYALKRGWDFLARNLLGAEPPADYELPNGMR